MGEGGCCWYFLIYNTLLMLFRDRVKFGRDGTEKRVQWQSVCVGRISTQLEFEGIAPSEWIIW